MSENQCAKEIIYVLQSITKTTMNHRMPGICRCKGHDRPDLFFPQ